MLSRFRFRFLNFWTIMTVLLLVFFAIALLYPLGTLFLRSFKTEDSGFSFANYITFFQKSYYYSALGHSMFIGFVTTIVATTIGVALAYVMHRYNIAFKGVLKILFVICLMSPPFIAIYNYVNRCEFGVAAALGTIMTVSILIALAVVARLTRKTGGII